MPRWLVNIRSWGISILIAFILSLLMHSFIIQPTKVIGHSMEPTLEDSSRIYVAKWVNTFGGALHYGDIVIVDSRIEYNRSVIDTLLEFPLIRLLMGTQQQDVFWVKRIIGKGGDSLELIDHQMFRNGEPITEPYLKEQMVTYSWSKITVPEGFVFVMGDNRNNSRDSRSIGAIPINHVLGKKI